MGECNRSYVAPQLGALLAVNSTAMVQIEPAVNYDKPAHYTQIWTRRKRSVEIKQFMCCARARITLFRQATKLGFAYVLRARSNNTEIINRHTRTFARHHARPQKSVLLLLRIHTPCAHQYPDEGNTAMFIFVYLVLNYLLVRHDIRSGLLPDRFTCPLLWSGLLWHAIEHTTFLPSAVFGAVAGYGSFALIYWSYRFVRKREGLGYGDVKYLAALGAWHGWQCLPTLIFFAALLACIATLYRVMIHRQLQALKNPLPFGPFLAAAGLLVGYQSYLSS